jgi:hypothetical protein
VKGYYTVKLAGGDLPMAERIALETRYVQALEAALGGAERVRDLCLAAAASGARPPVLPPELRGACEQAQESAWGTRAKIDGARFHIAAWTADDLA